MVQIADDPADANPNAPNQIQIGDDPTDASPDAPNQIQIGDDPNPDAPNQIQIGDDPNQPDQIGDDPAHSDANRNAHQVADAPDGRVLNLQPRIPHSLLHDMLSFLSVENLCRMRRVANSWNLLSKEWGFIEDHFKKSSALLFLQDKVQVERGAVEDKFFLPITNMRGQPSPITHYLPYRPFDRKYDGEYFVVGITFGIICLGLRANRESNPLAFSMLNPALRSGLCIDAPDLSPNQSITHLSTGFGFHPSNMFVLVCLFRTRANYILVQQYNFEDKQWSLLDVSVNQALRFLKSACDVVVEGVPIWMVFDEVLKVHSLAYFDHPTSGFNHVSLPFNFTGDYRLSELKDGYLGAFFVENSDLQIWRKKLIVGEWTRLHKIAKSSIPDFWMWGRVGHYCRLSPEGEIVLLSVGRHLLFINPHSLNVNNHISVDWNTPSDALAYKESLVELPPGYWLYY